MNQVDEILQFIRKFIVYCRYQQVSEHLDRKWYLKNEYCYWFAHILFCRFSDRHPVIMYDQKANHFGTEIDGRIYDITGDVTESYDWIRWADMSVDQRRDSAVIDQNMLCTARAKGDDM